MTLTEILITVAFVLIGGSAIFIWWYIDNRKGKEKKDEEVKEPEQKQDTHEPEKPEPAPVDIPEVPEQPEPEPVKEPEPEPEPEVIECKSETHKLGTPVSNMITGEHILVGTYDVNSDCGCEWSVVQVESGQAFLDNFKFSGGNIYAKVCMANDGYERTSRFITEHRGKSGVRRDYFDVTQQAGVFKEIFEKFSKLVNIPDGGCTYNYLSALFNEAKEQYYNKKSANGLPTLYVVNNFPTIYNYYQAGITCDDNVFKTLVGYLFAMQLAELNPVLRTKLFKLGYEIGGFGRYANIYGYNVGNDPNVARVVAGVIYAAMRGKTRPDVDAMRKETGGQKYGKTLEQLYDDEKRDHVSDDGFYIDLREFMPTAPGPYAPGYETRPDDTYPNEPKDEYKNLKVDRDIHEHIVATYNMDNHEVKQQVVQAIADKDSDRKHLFGDNVTVKTYSFHPVFGLETIGIRIDPESRLARLVIKVLSICSSARGILQSASVNPKQYGRLRPGCSWKQESKKNSKDDDRRNVLCNWWIEDGDNNPTGYYDQNGNWVYPSQVSSPEEYEELYKNTLYANSFPSGHSSGITGGSLVEVEAMPDKADVILREMIEYCNNRSMARYHWTSDTINGRVLGVAMFAVCHAANDFDALMEKIREQLEGGEKIKINTQLSYAIGGYGSCHVDPGEKTLYHNCNKECAKERHPSINVNQRVNFTIEGGGMTTVDGRTSGVWEAGKNYELICPAIKSGEEKVAVITMSNENGVRILNYKLSRNSTHDDGPGAE